MAAIEVNALDYSTMEGCCRGVGALTRVPASYQDRLDATLCTLIGLPGEGGRVLPS